MLTLTCFQWLPLFDKTNTYDTVYKWFDYFHRNNIYTTGYVLMPNHLHVILYLSQMPKSLNTIIGNAKRFIGYEMIKRLKEAKEENLLVVLKGGVKEKKRKDRYTKSLKIVLMQNSATVKILSFRNLPIFIVTR